MPQYFHDFIEPMTIPTGGTKNIAVPTEPKNVDRGSVIRSAPMVPRNPYLLESEVFSTTLQDGNVVGNIYFGNYYIWQSRVRDKFLVRSQREAMAARGALGGELRCVHTRVEHLREVMPFDDVLVTMSLSASTRGGGSTSSSSTSRSTRTDHGRSSRSLGTELSGRCRALRENWKSLRRRNFHSR